MERFTVDRYANRKEAGLILAEELRHYKNRDDVVVLALPRGGVPVGFEIAKALDAPLDVFIVRKLGVPGHSELAMGALATGGARVFNESVIQSLNISRQDIDNVIEAETKELHRREEVYRQNQAFPDLKDKIVILVDDGIATGASMRAAIKALKQFKPQKLVVAVPVADREICIEMQDLVDQFICPLQPLSLYAVGAWYQDFTQTEDDEVEICLRDARKVKS